MFHRVLEDGPLAEVFSGRRGERHRSISKKVERRPFSETSLILAAHGDRGGGVSQALGEMALKLRDTQGFPQVLTTFHQGSPRFGEVLSLVSVGRAVVVPVFMAEGYYSRHVLPRELRSSLGRALEVYITPVVGASERLRAALTSQIRKRCKEMDWKEEETNVIVLGHGTPRAASSRETVLALVSHVEQGTRCPSGSAFLDDSPSAEEAMEKLEGPNCLVIPFLFGGGGHTTELAGLFRLSSLEQQMNGVTGIDPRGRSVLIDRAVGEHSVMIEIISDLASNPELWRPLVPPGERNAG